MPDITKLVEVDGSEGRRWIAEDRNIDVEICLTEGACWAFFENGMLIDMDFNSDDLMKKHNLTL